MPAFYWRYEGIIRGRSVILLFLKVSRSTTISIETSLKYSLVVERFILLKKKCGTTSEKEVVFTVMVVFRRAATREKYAV